MQTTILFYDFYGLNLFRKNLDLTEPTIKFIVLVIKSDRTNDEIDRFDV